MIVSDHKLIIIKTISEPYGMQSVWQALFSTLASNEIFQDLEFVDAARLDSLRIVKDITLVIGKNEFVVDLVLAPLAPWLARSN